MKIKLSSIIFIILFSLPAQAEMGFFGVKGEVWNDFKQVNKYMYISGLFDGLIFSNFMVHEVKLTTKISTEQYIKAVDTIYSDYRNSLIPVPFVLKIVTLEINGANKDTIDAELLSYRKEYSKSK